MRPALPEEAIFVSMERGEAETDRKISIQRDRYVMKIFAIDSSAKSASAALVEDEKILGEFYIHTQLTHSETLMPMAEALFQNTRISLDGIDALAVSAGPGSFTGIRIGVGCSKRDGYGSGESPVLLCLPWKPLLKIIGKRMFLACAVMDARCSQVYNALFDCGQGQVSRLCEDRAISIEDLFQELEASYGTSKKKIVFYW